MIRNLVRFLIIVFVIAMVRALISAFARAVAARRNAETADGRPASKPNRAPLKSMGELRKDPETGVYVPHEPIHSSKAGSRENS